MSDHTPRSWKVRYSEHDPYGDIEIVDEKGRVICRLWMDDAPVHDYNEQQEANANLIAAAPELLEALEFVTDKCALYGPHDQARSMARKAIAKAKGE